MTGSEAEGTALSVQQPWAWLLALGLKPVENRTWAPAYRGLLWIHASRVPSNRALGVGIERLAGALSTRGYPNLDSLLEAYLEHMARHDFRRSGALVGRAELDGCARSAEELEPAEALWFTGPVGLRLRGAEELAEPRPWRGQLGLWRFAVPADLLPHEPPAWLAYCERIEACFRQLRGSPRFRFSPADFALLESWREAGVPAATVERGLVRAFERHRDRAERINSLAYCAAAVRAEARKPGGLA